MSLLTDIRRTYRALRSVFAGRPRPSGPYLRVRLEPGEIERRLGGRSYAPNWEFSYYKRGEDLNLARVLYADGAAPSGGPVWWQYHVRGWRGEDADGAFTDLRCHLEPEPTEAPDEHLAEEGLDLGGGMRNLRSALDGLDVGYEEVNWSADENVAATHTEDPR